MAQVYSEAEATSGHLDVLIARTEEISRGRYLLFEEQKPLPAVAPTDHSRTSGYVLDVLYIVQTD